MGLNTKNRDVIPSEEVVVAANKINRFVIQILDDGEVSISIGLSEELRDFLYKHDWSSKQSDDN